MKSKKIKTKTCLYIISLILLPFISIILIIQFRHAVTPTNEDIIKKIKDENCYKTNAEYIIKNNRGEYSDNTQIFYKRKLGHRVEFESDIIKIYKNEKINVFENNTSYEINNKMDILYPLGFIDNILNKKILDVKEGSEEWGDTKYLKITIDLESSNKHLSEAKVYINKKDKKPIVTKVYNDNGDETVVIVYKNFKYLDNLKKDLFK